MHFGEGENLKTKTRGRLGLALASLPKTRFQGGRENASNGEKNPIEKRRKSADGAHIQAFIAVALPFDGKWMGNQLRWKA